MEADLWRGVTGNAISVHQINKNEIKLRKRDGKHKFSDVLNRVTLNAKSFRHRSKLNPRTGHLPVMPRKEHGSKPGHSRELGG